MTGNLRLGMLQNLVALATVFLLFACAGFDVLHAVVPPDLDTEAVFLVFPFRDPSLDEKVFPGVGSRFTNAVVRSASERGGRFRPVFEEGFSSEAEISLDAAVARGRKSGATYVVLGRVTKWVDRATEWSGLPDQAALAVDVWSLAAETMIASVEVEQHSSEFSSGRPDDFIISLSDRVVSELLGEGPP